VAIDVIPGDSCILPRYDVLNTARPTDGNSDGAAGCDAGAYEAGTRVLISPLTPDVLADDGFCGLREALLSAESGVSSGKKAGECTGGVEHIALSSNAVYTLSGSALVVGSNVTLEGNNASIVQPDNGERALIVTEGGTLNMRNVTLSAAPMSAHAARIHASGAITVGGGVLIAPGGVANIVNSAIVRFRSSGPGGGVLNYGVLNLANSTISGNRSDGSGGGIHNAGIARVSLVTIADNLSDAEGDGAGDGGGIANEGFALLRANLIARNQDGSPGTQHADLSSVSGRLESGGYNVLGVDAGAPAGLVASDVRGTAGVPLDAGISALGGTPPRHTLNAGSPALRRVPAAACRFASETGNELFGADETAAVDQTGAARGTGGTACAAGAVEANAPSNVWLPLLSRSQ
jgi:hypothetical protein